ncbi:unnamed protein product [Pelagomonas calceolata]|uniref:Anoctamin transmembrane domain-containing protein n=1 Tax=Pelagomonas calceolata TaxID=35677 RepID=A0A7S4E8J5_9STRA|nr:unnamed protein product [Pelagomonas calceolata]
MWSPSPQKKNKATPPSSPQPKKFSWSPLPRRRKRTNIASPTVAALSPAKVVQLVRDRRTGLGEDEFRAKYGYGWDACVCFTVVDNALTEQQQSVITRLESGGIETKLVESSDGKRRWALLRAPVHRLARAADALDWVVPMNEEKVKEAIERGGPGIKGRKLRHDPKLTNNVRPYECIHGKYETNSQMQVLYEVPRGYPHLFAWPLLRLKLLGTIIEQRPSRGGCGVNFHRLQKNNIIEAAYPLHDVEKREQVMEEFQRWGLRGDVNNIRDYVGDRLALYFAFVHHFTAGCALSAFVGVATTFIMYLEASVIDRPRAKSRMLPFFSAFQCIWAIGLLEHWKRKESRLAMRWGTLGLAETVPDRPGFRGPLRPSLVDGRPEAFYPAGRRRRHACIAFFVVAALIIVLVWVNIGIIYMRVVLTRAFDKTTSSIMAARYASVVASVINTIAIQIMNYLFQYVARFFNTWENHRTDVEHYNNLILKLISFNFCNYNIPLVYNAFFQRHLEGCPRGNGDIEPGKGTCYSALEMNLGIIFLTKWFSGLCMDLLIPYLEKKYKRHKHPELTDERDGKHEAELQFDLAPTDGFEDQIQDMSNIAMRFGFITLFITALPCLPLVAWIANKLEVAGDLKKYLYFKRRLWPRVAWSIGSWTLVFQLIAAASVTTNTACIFYTVRWQPLQATGRDEKLRPNERAFAFFACQYFVFALMLGIAVAVPDTPEDVEIQLKRKAFICSKLLDRTPDEESDDEDAPSPLTVQDSDDDEGMDQVDQEEDAIFDAIGHGTQLFTQRLQQKSKEIRQMKVVRGMAKAETGVLKGLAQADKALDHVVSDDSEKGPTWGNVDALDTPHRQEVLGSGVDAFFSPVPKKPSPKKRSTPRKKVTSPRTEDHHLGALFDACGPGTSPRVSPRVSPRPSLDGDDDEQALFDAIIVDDESSPRASPRTSPMPSPKLPPPTQSTTPHLASSGFNFDALPAPGEGKPVTGEVGPPPVPTPGKYAVAHASVDKSPFDDSLDDPGEAV